MVTMVERVGRRRRTMPSVRRRSARTKPGRSSGGGADGVLSTLLGEKGTEIVGQWLGTKSAFVKIPWPCLMIKTGLKALNYRCTYLYCYATFRQRGPILIFHDRRWKAPRQPNAVALLPGRETHDSTAPSPRPSRPPKTMSPRVTPPRRPRTSSGRPRTTLSASTRPT